VPRTTKQDTKTCMLRDNAGDAHYCYGCYRGTCLPPLELVIQGEARLTAHRLESGTLVLPSPHPRAQQYIDAVSEVGSNIEYGGRCYEASTEC
jgi:hypothetical protein